MTSNPNRKRIALNGGTALQALALLGVGVSSAALVATPAAAQDFTTGALVGTVQTADGTRATGGTVTVTSTAQGFTRTTNIGANGTFRVQTLPAGTYTVTVTTPGNAPVENRGIAIAPGSNTTYTFTVGAPAAAGDDTGGDIVVTASAERGNDFGSNTGGLNIGDVSQLLNTTPIARNQTALIALAPGVSLGDTAFGNLPTIGGATVAENAYYVNGLNVTNFRNFVGSNNPPIEFYRSVDVKSFGLSAEFGRVLGGFTTVVTKAGTNSWEAGAVVAYTPDGLRSNSPNTYAAFNQNDYRENIEANFYLSGPIIKDRLFFYALYNPNYSKQQDSSISAGNRLTTKNSSPFFGGKVDFIIADGHRLEGTYFSNRQTFRTNYDAFNASVNPDATQIAPIGTLAIGAPQGTLIDKSGGDNFVVSYTGQFTNWLSLSAAYGENHDERLQQPAPIQALIQSTLLGTTTTASGFNSANNRDDDTRKFYRADADVYVNLLGTHHFRGGWEREELTSTTDTRYASAYRYVLNATSLDRYFYENVGTWTSRNDSFYIQDNWSLLNERLTLQLGLRNDRFSNNALDGTTYFKSGNQWGPRLGAAFDVFGDKRTTIRGSWSRYFLPVATNTNIRLGGAELYYRQRFAYAAGVNPAIRNAAGLPAGINIGADGNITNLGALIGSRTCPGGPNNGQTCFSITSDGVQGPTDTLVSSSLAPSYTDEWSVGLQQRFGDWDFSLTYLNRRLGRTLDDVAIDAAVLKYCTANGIAGCADTWSGFHQYVLANPGDDITVRLDGDCSIARQCEVATLTAADLGFPKASRNYDSVQFQFNKAYRDGWQLGGSYVYTRLRGNYEGAVKSDIGQDDAGLTQDFDQPGLLDNAYGPLANGPTHSFKLFGAVKLLEGVRLGANVFVESPRRFSCYGYHPTDSFAAIYENASYFCRQPQFSGNGGVVTNLPLFGDPDYFGLNGQTRYPVRRGTAFKSDWRKQIDLNLGFDIAALPGSFFNIDVFNAFNFKSKLDFNEFGELASGELDGRFAQPIGYQTPRSVRFTFGLRFGGNKSSEGGPSIGR